VEKLPVSCFIIAQNEADRIARTIKSVGSWVDEVIVVDGGSSDDTVLVAQREGARVIYNPWPGFGQQKRFAEEQCRNDWLLNIDADEVISHRLRKEITGLFVNGSLPAFVAYGMPVQIVYHGATKPRLWARDHWFIRLYDHRVCRFRNSTQFDSVVVGKLPIGKLGAPIHHFSMRSLEDMKRKLNERMWIWVEHSEPRCAAFLLLRLITEIPLTFLKYYFVRGHFTGGLMGLRYASVHSWYRFLKVYRLLHLKSSWRPWLS
jgi:glycosyltransferase involved in cell wall biosynthesis